MTVATYSHFSDREELAYIDYNFKWGTALLFLEIDIAGINQIISRCSQNPHTFVPTSLEFRSGFAIVRLPSILIDRAGPILRRFTSPQR